MEEMIFFDNAKDSVTNFFEKEFDNFPALLMSHFLNKFNDIMNYTEEGQNIKPIIYFIMQKKENTSYHMKFFLLKIIWTLPVCIKQSRN